MAARLRRMLAPTITLAAVPYLPHLNWAIGWLLFQMAGFAWRDGLLPTGRHMAAR